MGVLSCQEIFRKKKQDNFPSTRELLENKRIREAIVHDSKQTVFVAHDNAGKTYTACVKHNDKYDASNFINNGLPALIGGNRNNSKYLKDY